MNANSSDRSSQTAGLAGQTPPAVAVTRQFTNELGNRIKITIEGPTSLSENILTPMEVAELREALAGRAVAVTEGASPTDAQIDAAKKVSGSKQNPFEAGCEVLAYLREHDAPYGVVARMLICLHQNNPDAEPRRFAAHSAAGAVHGLTDEQIANLRDRHGITSDGRGIKAFAQVKSFVGDILALAATTSKEVKP